jgi:hypothetical protein
VTTTGEVAVDPSPSPAEEEGEGKDPPSLVGELLLALEVTALAAFTFSRPVLDAFGRSPETFIARHASTLDIVLFGLVVAFVPAVIVAVVGGITRVFGAGVRLKVHLVLVALLGGLGAWRLGRDLTGWPNDATKLLLAGIVVGPLLAALRWWKPQTGTFLRYAGAASVIFLLQFLVMSPTTDVAFGEPPGVDDEVDAQVAADLGDDPPSVVFVVLDAFPTTTLLDGTGQVDAETFPNIGALAATSTWYRNDTTVAAFTEEAVPALLTGRFPDSERPSLKPDPENIFTLLGGSYDMHVKEEVTRLCPEELCPRGTSAGVGTLISDAVTWWQGSSSDEATDEFDLPAVLEEGRYEEAEQWIDDLRVTPGGRPDFTFLHVVLPHAPFQFTDEGDLYETPSGLPIGSAGLGWSQAGYEIGQQRHVLQAQAADKLIGQLFDNLREAGTFDDSLVVVTADHGESFVPDALGRGLQEGNVAHIMWTPLFVKAPGQTDGVVDDRNMASIDVMPTIADALGIEVPWDVDGLAAPDVEDERDPGVKQIHDSENHYIHANDGDELIEIEGTDELFAEVLEGDAVPGQGPDGVWKRTFYGDLVGESVTDLSVGEPADQVIELEDSGRLDDVDLDEPLPIEVIGGTPLPVGTTVAYALNGTVGAVTTVEPWPLDGGNLVHGLIPPAQFVDGANELTAFLVEGQPDDVTLRPLDLT